MYTDSGMADAGLAGFRELWASLAPIGRHPGTGGYRRFSWTDADLECRAWFTAAAERREMSTETDRNGNLWAWWGEPGPGAVVTGSHLDSVPDGGAFDGPLGVVSAFAAVDLLRARGVTPSRPVAVVAFTEEEGARFGMACLGSRLVTGMVDPGTARDLRDQDGVTLAEAMARAGHDPDGLGADSDRLGWIEAFVELHVEQGRALVDLGAPIGVATAIWPHGRWRFELTGAADHAGTTRLADRRDPMPALAQLVLTARQAAADTGAVATVGRIQVEPNGINAIPSSVRVWLDARAATEETVYRLVDVVHAATSNAADSHGVGVARHRESWTPEVTFHQDLRDRLADAVGGAFGSGPRDQQGPAVPLLPTAAGHDAGILAAAVPSGMLFVRNPTGVSHAPSEHAEEADCVLGVRALAAVLADLAA